ncbi:hypothetical protein Vau01_063840 [Virgisporangium aurantiacum]|uniref:Uncharacterized protein n=1 Tax=Virgisporangium aurantiacum TaxID=175570 RepID=A0A8J3ZCT6_9ACTN|nr:hypothetical protein Vau01_063840 [Virgisporangium aurantiacum]
MDSEGACGRVNGKRVDLLWQIQAVTLVTSWHDLGIYVRGARSYCQYQVDDTQAQSGGTRSTPGAAVSCLE